VGNKDSLIRRISLNDVKNLSKNNLKDRDNLLFEKSNLLIKQFEEIEILNYNDLVKGHKGFIFSTNYYVVLVTFFLSFLLFLQIDSKWYIDKLSVETNEKFKNIEFLRFIFAIFIIMQHIGLGVGMRYLPVEYFFIIAGFLFYKTIDKIDTISLKKFVVNRFFRLWPIYYLMLSIYQIYNNNTKPLFEKLLFLGSVYDVGNRLWFCQIIFWVGIIYFSIFKYFKNKYIKYILYFLILRYFYFYIYNGYSIEYEIDKGFAYMGLGLILYEFWNSYKLTIKNKFEKYAITFFELYCFTWLIVESIFIKPIEMKNIDFQFITYIIIFIFLLYFFVEKKGVLSNFLYNNFSVQIGKYSYAMYVCHETLFRDILKDGYNFYNKIGLYGVYEQLTIIILSIITAIILYHTIENPISNLIKTG
jgi:peptidoglycan/LPS O-acetylase OafA/YrhL